MPVEVQQEKTTSKSRKRKPHIRVTICCTSFYTIERRYLAPS